MIVTLRSFKEWKNYWKRKSNNQRLWNWEIWRDAFPSLRSKLSFPFEWISSISRSLDKGSCYWLAKEISNYKKNAFCSFQGIGGFYHLGTHQGTCNLCKVQITFGKISLVTRYDIYTHFQWMTHYLAITQTAKIFVFWEKSNTLVVKGYSLKFVVLLWEFHFLCIKMQHL